MLDIVLKMLLYSVYILEYTDQIIFNILKYFTLHEKCPYSEFFWSLFPAFVLNTENTDQKNSEYRHFLRSVAR